MIRPNLQLPSGALDKACAEGSRRVLRLRAIATAPSDILALLGRRADAATAAAEARPAALRLALVVLEHEEAVGTGLKLGAQQGLIRGRVAPARNTVAGG